MSCLPPKNSLESAPGTQNINAMCHINLIYFLLFLLLAINLKTRWKSSAICVWQLVEQLKLSYDFQFFLLPMIFTLGLILFSLIYVQKTAKHVFAKTAMTPNLYVFITIYKHNISFKSFFNMLFFILKSSVLYYMLVLFSIFPESFKLVHKSYIRQNFNGICSRDKQTTFPIHF